MGYIMYFSYLLFIGLALAAYCIRTGRQGLAMGFLIVTSFICSILHGTLKKVAA